MTGPERLTAHVGYAFTRRQGAASIARYHAVLDQDMPLGARLNRRRGDALCKPAAKFYDLSDQCNRSQVTCPECLARADRYGIEVRTEGAVYPAPGSEIPGQPGYVVGECEHRLAASEWRAGFRTCERCDSKWEDPGTGTDFFGCDHETSDAPGHDPAVCPRIADAAEQGGAK